LFADSIFPTGIFPLKAATIFRKEKAVSNLPWKSKTEWWQHYQNSEG
jgi:hypothetical protein